jgi:hypothetical protein
MGAVVLDRQKLNPIAYNSFAFMGLVLHSMKQLIFSLSLLLMLQTLCRAQAVSHAYTLSYKPSSHQLSGRLVVQFQNQQTEALDSLYLHLPSRALEWKGSSLNHQLLEYQKVESHFADEEEVGTITVHSLRVDQTTLKPCSACEFIGLPLSTPLQPGTQIELVLAFDLLLPEYTFTGIGVGEDESVRIAAWLPKMAALCQNSWLLYPYRLQNDLYPQNSQVSMQLTLPATAEVFSNLNPQTAEDRALLGKQDSSASSPANKTIHLSGSAADVQLFWSEHYLTHTLENGQRIATEDGEYAWAALAPVLEKKISKYLYSEGLDSVSPYDLLLVNKKMGEYQSCNSLVVMDVPKDAFVFETELVYALAQQKLRYQLAVDGFEEAWIARGLPYFYKYQYIEEKYPQKAWLPFSFSFLGRFFDLDEFTNPYQNAFLYLYLARQNLDQAMATNVDSLTRLNYEAVIEAKAYLSFRHLRAYVGDPNFKRAIHRYYTQYTDTVSAQVQLQNAFAFYHNQPVAAFFGDYTLENTVYDFALVHTDYCPTVATATVINRGTVMLPYSLTGYKDNKAIYTEWFQPHEGKRSVQLMHNEYDYVVLNAHLNEPEYSQKNNRVRRRGLFRQMEPLRLQFYNSFERPDRTQIFWLPSIGYNAYDQVLLGVRLSNTSLVQKKFEYAVSPELSTGTGSLTGYASLVYNHPSKSKSSLLRQWSTGVFARYYHYDRDLGYFRVSPAINFYFEDPHAYRSIRQRLRFRGVRVDRELPAMSEVVDGSNTLQNASYTIFNAQYKLENISIIKPYTLKADFQLGDQFSRFDIEADMRYMLPNKKWLIWRNFAGVFFQSSPSAPGNPNYYSYGLSGTQDYLFDYSLIGRSDEAGVWSRQFFVTDGGFKSETNVFADNFILSSNLSLPLYSFFGLYGDVGVVDNFNTLYWDCGIRLAFLTDFVEVYLPFYSNQTSFITEPDYFSQTRFVLDINIGNIIARARRGYY